MQDGDKDGVYTFATDELDDGSYEAKVAHGRVVGRELRRGRRARRRELHVHGEGRASSSSSATRSRRTCSRSMVTEPAARGHGRVAGALAGRGHAGRAEDLRRRGRSDRTHLHARALARGDPGRRRRRGRGRRRADRARVSIPPASPTSRRAKFPQLADYAVLRPVGLDRDDGGVSCSPSSSGSRSASTASSPRFTGVQLPGVLDDLYADALASTPLGATVTGLDSTVRLWAPTAQSVSLRSGTPARPATRRVIPAEFDATNGTWSVDGPSVGDEYRWSVEVYAPTTGKIEVNSVTDPYSVALTTNSARSVDREPRRRLAAARAVGRDARARGRATRRPRDLRAARARLLDHRRDRCPRRSAAPTVPSRATRRAPTSCASSRMPASTPCTCCRRSTSPPSRRTAPRRRSRLRPRVVRAGIRRAAGVHQRHPRPRRLQLGLRPVPLPGARGLLRGGPERRRPRRGVPGDGRRPARHGPAGRARRGVQPHRGIRPG